MPWHEVMSEDELWEGDMAGVEAAGVKILLINIDGDVRAYENRCPHKASPLGDGELEDGVLTCGTHLWEFDARTGAGVNPATSQLTVFPVRVENGLIYVGLGESSAR